MARCRLDPGLYKAYGRDVRSALSADAEVSLVVVEALAQVSTSFSLCLRVHGFLWLLRRIQRLLLVVVCCVRGCAGYSTVRGSCAATCDGGLSALQFPRDCFIRPRVGEEGDDDVASVVSNPQFWIKPWLIWPLLSMTLIPSLVRCPLLRSLPGTILHLC